jgi:hypothetical protein
LSSVLLIENTNDDRQTVRIFHPSFRDFLLERCQHIEKDVRFSIVSAEQHHFLALRCLKLLNRKLCENICDLQDPSQANSEIPDLAQRLRNRVPDAVRYASAHWAAHLAAAAEVNPTPESVEEINIIIQQHWLHWVELLSLQGRLVYAFQSLPVIAAWCQVRCHLRKDCLNTEVYVEIK